MPLPATSTRSCHGGDAFTRDVNAFRSRWDAICRQRSRADGRRARPSFRRRPPLAVQNRRFKYGKHPRKYPLLRADAKKSENSFPKEGSSERLREESNESAHRAPRERSHVVCFQMENIMNTKKISSRSDQQAADQRLFDGLTKHAQTLPSFLVSGAPVKTADLLATLQTRLAVAKPVDSDRAAWLTAVQAYRDERAKSDALVSGVRQALHVMFAGSIETLADFGLSPRKVSVVSPETKVAAAAKAKATREARHTMGKNQKKAVKGDVTGVVVNPVTSPNPVVSAPVTPATPAPSGGAPAAKALS
jgi:hypothetical protein